MNKALKDYTREEWEAVCNRCGKCCLVKIQDDETDEIFYTDVVCRYMDMETCTCTRYDERCTLVPSCLIGCLNPVPTAPCLSTVPSRPGKASAAAACLKR